MTVDLSTGRQGILVFETGKRYWCPEISKCPEVEKFSRETWANPPDTWKVRIESGWHQDYMKDGRTLKMVRTSEHGGHLEPGSNGLVSRIVEFIPCRHDDPRAKALPTEFPFSTSSK